MRFSIIKKNKAFQKNYIKVGVKKLLRAGIYAVEIEETDGSCGRKKSTTSLSLFMEVYGLEVEDEISTMATQYWAGGVWTGKWSHEQKEAWMTQIREVQTWKQVRGPAGAVICEKNP